MASPKAWFITGASGGLGRAWAEAALNRGDRVVATVRDSASLTDLAQKHPGALSVLTLDVIDRDAVFAAVDHAREYLGRLDVVVCAAGYGYMSAVEEIDPEEGRTNFNTNVFGTLAVIQAALPILRAQGSGHILTVSSVGGVVAFPTGGMYLATKFAVEALSEALAGEVEPFGIKVTIIEPGSFATGFGSAVRKAPALDMYNPLREQVRAGFKPGVTGDPVATAKAVLTLVDAPEPPLRLILGNWVLPLFKQTYQQRIETWEQWAGVANAAQGFQAG